MSEESSGQEKTEDPTSRRLQEARKKGDVLKSMEVPSAAVLLCGLLAIYSMKTYMYDRLLLVMRYYLSQLHSLTITPDNLLQLSLEVMTFFALLVGPLMIVIFITALASNYAQVGVIFSTEKIVPKFEKIDPLKGLQRLFSMQTLFNTLKSIAKLAIVGWVAYSVVKDNVYNLLPLMDQTPLAIFIFYAKISFWMFLKAALIIAGLAALDWLFQRWQFMKKMKMTKQEIKEEAKNTEGDPHVKGRIRSIQMEMARKRMMADVPHADVIITNPTRLAIAIKYDSATMAAPKVVAKGAGVIAHRIKEIAKENRIPLMEDKPLAQALYKTVEIGEEIPANLFQAVAEILAHVYSVKRKAA
ncbi:MAG: flagellar biosynthesis protein FlhB [Proteobacteria bacterium]|nr:flagellar biosynthesis protein FlhB [Pseudomonadota bacterium]MBU1640938.1 flagellar biosynthesis protein FlhB [Pseudomonadota bacterium]